MACAPARLSRVAGMTGLVQVLHAAGIAGLFSVFCLGTGIVAVRWLRLTDGLIVPVGFGCTALIGMLAFCAWWASPGFGASFSLACGLGAAALFASQATDRETRRQMRAATPVLLATLLLAATLLCLVHAAGVPAAKRLTWTLPIDDQLPRMFADRIAASRFTGPIDDHWLASDRPPLQTALLLMLRPFLAQAGLAREVVETLCQLMWLPALAALGGVLRLGRKAVFFGLLFCTTSGFFLVNSIYVWPKLMAAALVVTAVAVVIEFDREGGARRIRIAAMAGALLALGTLAHGGVWFSLLALPALPVARSALRRFGIRGLVVVGMTFLVTGAPWTAYKRFVEPPGNRLVKWHLAGDKAVDTRSAFEAVTDAYSKTPFADIAKARWENAKTVALVPPPMTGEHSDAYLRRLQFFYFVPAIGLPLVGALWMLFLRRTGAADAGAKGLILFSFATVAVWVALMFSPGSTIVHQGSYAPVTLLVFLGAASIARWHISLLVAATAFHAVLFFAVWIVTTPTFDGARLNPFLMAAAGLFMAGTIAVLAATRPAAAVA